MAGREQLLILSWLSPSFPVGSYSYSHGLEAAVEAGMIADRPSCEGWLRGLLTQGSGRQDAWLLVRAHRAVRDNDLPRLVALTELGEAMRPTAELALESRAQGEAFLSLVRVVWPDPTVEAYAELLEAGDRKPVYPVAVAVATAAHQVAVADAVMAYLHAFVANLISAAVRLVPLGQTDGQRLMASLESDLLALTERTLAGPADDARHDHEWPGSATPTADWSSLAHETQYTRLFRS